MCTCFTIIYLIMHLISIILYIYSEYTFNWEKGLWYFCFCCHFFHTIFILLSTCTLRWWYFHLFIDSKQNQRDIKKKRIPPSIICLRLRISLWKSSLEFFCETNDPKRFSIFTLTFSPNLTKLRPWLCHEIKITSSKEQSLLKRLCNIVSQMCNEKIRRIQ